MELVIVQIFELSYCTNIDKSLNKIMELGYCTNIVQIIEYYGTKLLYELLTKLLHKYCTNY